jgi:hypothetical protein
VVDRLTEGEKLLGGSALGLYIISFIGFWAELEIETGGSRFVDSVTAWDGYGLALKLALILALVAVGLVAARATTARFDLPVPWGLVYVGIASLTLLLILLAVLIGPDESPSIFNSAPSDARIGINRGVGLFIGTLLAGTMAAGGYQHMKSGDTTTRSPATPTSSSPPTTPMGA